MDDPLSPSAFPRRGAGSEGAISCDSCLRSSSSFKTTKCVGGPICERCSLHGFECIFSPGETGIEGLKTAFSTLLIPGMERPRTPSPISSRWEEESEFRRVEKKSEGKEVEVQVVRGMSILFCSILPEFIFFYSLSLLQHRVRLTNVYQAVIKEEESPTCTTCKIWNSPHCDLRMPTCSSCEVRGVECVYASPPMSMPSRHDRGREPLPRFQFTSALYFNALLTLHHSSQTT